MSHATISFVVLGAAVVLFILNRRPPEIVALGADLAPARVHLRCLAFSV